MTKLHACIFLAALTLFANASAGELHDAAKENDVASVEQLLAEGVDVNEQESQLNKTALDFAAYRGHMEIARLLVQRGANVNAKDKTKVTPLHSAALAGQEAMAEFLISKGANIDARAGLGDTPLAVACLRGHEAVADVLLRAGADANLPNNTGKSPLHLAAAKGHVEIIRQLLAGGAQVDAGDKPNNNTPLLYAAQHDHAAAAEALISLGADVNHVSRKGLSALALAVLKSKAIVEVLIRHGADVNITFGPDLTPLHGATQKRNLEVVELLLKAGADIDARARNGKSSLDMARDRGHEDIVRLLKQHGAKTGRSSGFQH